jgi:hypothetical protein
MASRQLLIPRIAAVGTSFSPLPCHAWHGYGVTSAHRVEVEVGADGPASAPPSGALLAYYTKGDPSLLDNYCPIALMNNLLKLRTTLIKDSGSKYAETHGILSDPHDGFRFLHNIPDALASIIMMMEDAKIYNKDIYVMYANFKGAFNAADHRIMFKHMCQFGMHPSFVDTCEQLYGVCTTDNNTPYGPTLSIYINRGTLQGDTLFPSLFTLSLEPFLRLLTVSSRGYRHRAPSTDSSPRRTYGNLPGSRLCRRPQPFH